MPASDRMVSCGEATDSCVGMAPPGAYDFRTNQWFSIAAPLENVLGSVSKSQVWFCRPPRHEHVAGTGSCTESCIRAETGSAENIVELSNIIQRSPETVFYVIEQKSSSTGLRGLLITAECMKYLEREYSVTPLMSRLTRQFRLRIAVSAGDSWAGGFVSRRSTEDSGTISLPNQELWYLVNFVQVENGADPDNGLENFGWCIRTMGLLQQTRQKGPEMWLCFAHTDIFPWFTALVSSYCSPSQNPGFQGCADPPKKCPVAGLLLHLEIIQYLTGKWEPLYEDLSHKFCQLYGDFSTLRDWAVTMKSSFDYSRNLESLQIASMSEHLCICTIQSLKANLKNFDSLRQKSRSTETQCHHPGHRSQAQDILRHLCEEIKELKSKFEVLLQDFKTLGRMMDRQQNREDAEILRMKMGSLEPMVRQMLAVDNITSELTGHMVVATVVTSRTQKCTLMLAPSTLLTSLLGWQFISTEKTTGGALRVIVARECWTIAVPLVIATLVATYVVLIILDRAKLPAITQHGSGGDATKPTEPDKPNAASGGSTLSDLAARSALSSLYEAHTPTAGARERKSPPRHSFKRWIAGLVRKNKAGESSC